MSPVEYEDLPTMGDMCFGKHWCEECQEYNAGGTCPCGWESPGEEASP